MPKQSAGLVIYRRRNGGVEVFLVHPGGPFWQNKDQGAWSIPKGEFQPGDDPLEAARCEFQEETGSTVEGHPTPIPPHKQPGGKVVHAFLIEADFDPAKLRSNTFLLEWPRGSGQMREFPEVDRGEWFSIGAAREKILAGQLGILDAVERLIHERDAS